MPLHLVSRLTSFSVAHPERMEPLDVLRPFRACSRDVIDPILLFDEIDLVIARGQVAHNESWSAAINNALLTETAAEGRPGVVFLAATNFPDRVDEALRRSGRLDRVVTLGMPDPEQLARIVGFHLPGLSPADGSRAAAEAAGSSGADIDRLAWAARRRARSEQRDV